MPQILAVEFKQIERVEHGLADRAMTVQRVEYRDPIRPADHGLPVDGERLRGAGPQCWRSQGTGRSSRIRVG
jgi:hypothetical protein